MPCSRPTSVPAARWAAFLMAPDRSWWERDSRETSLRLADRRKMVTICLRHCGSSPVQVERGRCSYTIRESNLDAIQWRTILAIPKFHSNHRGNRRVRRAKDRDLYSPANLKTTSSVAAAVFFTPNPKLPSPPCGLNPPI
jgi:hypothetical protein